MSHATPLFSLSRSLVADDATRRDAVSRSFVLVSIYYRLSLIRYPLSVITSIYIIYSYKGIRIILLVFSFFNFYRPHFIPFVGALVRAKINF